MGRFVSVLCAVVVVAGVADAQTTSKTIDIRKLTANELHVIEQQAKRGQARAMTILGMAYAEGTAVGRHVEAGVKWLKQAAKVDDVAQTYLAQMYRDGDGVSKDLTQARAYFAKAAAQGNVTAQYNYASLCFNGDGGPQDVDVAAKFFEIAARQGDLLSEQMIARMYQYGRGVVKDPQQAIYWFNKAAQRDYGPALYALGVAYAEGAITEKNTPKAVELFKKATAHGEWPAALRLANIYMQSDSGMRNEAEAYKWFAIAHEMSGGEIAPAAETLAEKLGPAQIASEKREAQEWKSEHVLMAVK